MAVHIPADKEKGRAAAAALTLRTPCCDAPFFISYRDEGHRHMRERVVDRFECTGLGCDNEWFADGTPSMIRATEEDSDLPGYRPFHTFEGCA